MQVQWYSNLYPQGLVLCKNMQKYSELLTNVQAHNMDRDQEKPGLDILRQTKESQY